jgi:glycosyltransferase involved in cell wall biosynthesis
MRVLISALSRFRRPSGICRHAANLAAALAKAPEIAKIFFVIGDWQLEYFRDLIGDEPRIDLIIVSSASNSFARNLWYLFELPKVAKKSGVDIVHCSFPIPVLRGKFTARIVTTIHDLYPYDCPENFGFPAVWFNRAFLRQALKNSDGLVCDSRDTLNRLTMRFSSIHKRKTMAVIPNYVAPKFIQPSRSAQLPSSAFVLCVGQHRKNKNIDMLIAAFSELVRARPTLALVIVGSAGPETDHLAEIAKTSVPAGRIKFVSGLSDAEMAWVYKNCELLVIPSTHEGFCLPLIEGIDSRARVVCSDIPILREVGSEDCVYFDLNSGARGLMMAMRDALKSGKPRHATSKLKCDQMSIARLHVEHYRKISSSQAFVLR